MRIRAAFPALALVAYFHSAPAALEKEEKPAAPTSWGYVSNGPVDLRRAPSARKSAVALLERGALVPILQVKSKEAAHWALVRVVDPGKLNPKTGWVEANQLETLPLERFPADADILKLLGGAYLEDYTASQTQIARFLVRQGRRDPALVCFLGAPVLPSARLQVFFPSQAKFIPGPLLEFASSEMDTGITSLEVRDLTGDGNESLITHESFQIVPQNRGTRIVIRRIEDSGFKILWRAPLEFRNLASFPPRQKALSPPEKNIGAPGTVTIGNVEFRQHGGVREPVWKGRVEFRALGREEPVETLAIEKVCPWDGTRFAPLE